MALITTNDFTSRFGKTTRVVSLVLISLFACMSCSQHYCPTYASTTYHKSFTYAPTKDLAYKPVKVHEFKNTKVNKSEKKGKAKAQVR